MQTNRKPRSTKAKVVTTATAPTYPGPSLDDILKLSNEQVQVSFDELGVEPSPFHWNPEDDQLNRAHWTDLGMTMSSEERVKAPLVPIRELKDSSFGYHQACLRTELLSAHVKQWISGLEDVQLIQEVERFTEAKLSESQKRYLKQSELRGQLEGLIWPVLVSQSKLYVQPQSPLTQGGKP